MYLDITEKKSITADTDEDSENTTMCHAVDPLRSTKMQHLTRLQGQRPICQSSVHKAL